MSLALLIAIGGLTSVGIYLITARSLSRIILGFSLLGHAAVLALLASGGSAGRAPIGASVDGVSDPLPQAFSLTAIVISFGLSLFLLALALRQRELTGDDLVQDDIEDRRIAQLAANGPNIDDSDSDSANESPEAHGMKETA